LGDLKDILRFPLLLGGMVLSVLYHTLTEVEALLIALASICLGWKLGWDWGLTIFVTWWALAKLLQGYVHLMASKLHMIAQANSRSNR
jgi:hypothetical protein